MLDPPNSTGNLGSYRKINYLGTGKSTIDYVGAMAYGRKITGRLAFQIAAGPQEIRMFVPGGIGNFNLLFVSVNSALTYQRRRGSVSIDFVRGLNSGSGVFVEATTDPASANAHYQFSRNWTGSINGGYSLNNSLAPAGVASTQFD